MKGRILPSVTHASSTDAEGTFVFDAQQKSVLMREKNTWVNLTINEEKGKNHSFSNTGNDKGSGAIIGSSKTDKPGALVLESTTKAMVLPKVSEPEKNMPSPVAGTMVYDTSKSALAVFDGSNWSYWR